MEPRWGNSNEIAGKFEENSKENSKNIIWQKSWILPLFERHKFGNLVFFLNFEISKEISEITEFESIVKNEANKCLRNIEKIKEND